LRSPFRTFHSLVLALFGTLAYQLLLRVNDWTKLDENYGPYIPIVVIGMLWLLFSSSRTISDKLLELMPVVRRAFAGRKHIEGDWPLVVVDSHTGELIYYGFMHIGFEEGQYTVSGTDWHPDGRHALNFRSKQSYQSHPTLHYWYEQGEGGRQRGYTFIEFFPDDRVPMRLTGVFHDPAHPNVRFYARKLAKPWMQSRIRDMEPRRQAAEAFMKEIMPRIPAIVRNGVDVDWG
jgi:hypothetical protein